MGDTPLNSYGTDNPDYIDTDSDDDNISDRHESGKTASDDIDSVPVNTDNTDKVDYLDTDSDNDGILDADEAGDTSLTTSPVNSDSSISGDSLPDYRDLDSDDNSILDSTEKSAANQDIDGDQIKNFQDLDDDGDNIPDVIEIGGGTPLNSDGANDGADYQDTDSDNDFVLDENEGVKSSSTGTTAIPTTYSGINQTPSLNLQDYTPGDTQKDGTACVETETCAITVNPSSDGDGTVDIQGTVTGLDYQTKNFAD